MANNRTRFLLALMGACLIAALLIRPPWQSLLTGAALGIAANACLYSRKDMKRRWKKFFAHQRDRTNRLR